MICNKSKRCQGCKYSALLNGNRDYIYCDYLTQTGQRRGCQVEDCTRYEPKQQTQPPPGRTFRLISLRSKAYDLRAQACTITQIAAELHIGTKTAANFAHDYDRIHGKPEFARSAPVIEGQKKRARYVELHRQGLSDRQIAEKMGIPVSYARTIRVRAGLPPNKDARRKKKDDDS